MARRANRWLWVSIAAVALGVVGVARVVLHPRHVTEDQPYDAPPISFDGSSDRLRQTVIVPTLDSPIPEGMSAIWCVSFQLAWNHLKDDVAKEPPRLTNARPIADRLNVADHSEDDPGPDAVYAAAGLAKDDIVQRIQVQMAGKFPNAPRPELDVPSDGAVAYAYLAASAKYDYPFFENDEPLLFKDSAGKKTAVGGFGVRKKDDYAYYQLRRQVQVLYCPQDSIWTEKEIPELIVDPCKNSKPYQIVLARVDRKPTLADTLADVEQKIAAQLATDHSQSDFRSGFHPRDTLLVPNIAWRVNHRFKELEGKANRFLNPKLQGLYLDTALQTIAFRLDRSGAELASESKVVVKPGASFFDFDRPFLVSMKKRGGKRPFFVMWVDNAELLEKK